jgi:hypothetical protein
VRRLSARSSVMFMAAIQRHAPQWRAPQWRAPQLSDTVTLPAIIRDTEHRCGHAAACCRGLPWHILRDSFCVHFPDGILENLSSYVHTATVQLGAS